MQENNWSDSTGGCTDIQLPCGAVIALDAVCEHLHGTFSATCRGDFPRLPLSEQSSALGDVVKRADAIGVFLEQYEQR